MILIMQKRKTSFQADTKVLLEVQGLFKNSKKEDKRLPDTETVI